MARFARLLPSDHAAVKPRCDDFGIIVDFRSGRWTGHWTIHFGDLPWQRATASIQQTSMKLEWVFTQIARWGLRSREPLDETGWSVRRVRSVS
ncbi:hypothetical protein N7539_003959 [Penicillium diatomitis]|uniref:Uncharacterized protein n=1 Tax=Penicillium diatomitis TaxID=2819901 RepID=A0A9W9XCU8_9EURO|nr:uncharacterized protein N7539_003959 [Penicillium diatomitis]KAJ5489069.1 hypothetical protein N7539_003959 [Penicillium diatomitis]